MIATPVRTALSQGPCPSLPRLASRYLGEYLDKIRVAVDRLDDQQVWWRPVEGTNSVGNQLLHLAGNLSLWIRHGIAGEGYERDRTGEFTADQTLGRDALVERLAGVVERCRAILEGLDGQPLDRSFALQGYDTDLRGAVFHATEHMSYHTGQILFIVKQLTVADDAMELYPQHRGE